MKHVFFACLCSIGVFCGIVSAIYYIGKADALLSAAMAAVSIINLWILVSDLRAVAKMLCHSAANAQEIGGGT